MKILLVSTNFAPEPVGIGKYSGELASWLARRGHEVDVLCSVPYYPQWRVDDAYRRVAWRLETPEPGLRVMRTPVAIPGGRVGGAARVVVESSFAAASVPWWARLGLGRRHDVVYCVCPPLQNALPVAAYAAARATPWVLHVQDFQVDAAVRLGILRAGAVARVAYAVEGSLLRRASCVSTISGAMAERAVEKGVPRGRVIVTPNWVDLDAVRPAPPDPVVRRRLGAHPGDVLVVYSGNVGEKQGLEVLLDAAELLRGRTDVAMAIVGEGTARARLEREAAERRLSRVTFHDLVPAPELGALIAASDVQLVLQRAEAADLVMPSKLTAILAGGRPSIVTAAGGTELHRVVAGERIGTCVAPGDTVALAAAITHLADDASERDELGSRARAYAVRSLGADAVLGALEADLERIVQAGRAGRRPAGAS